MLQPPKPLQVVAKAQPPPLPAAGAAVAPQGSAAVRAGHTTASIATASIGTLVLPKRREGESSRRGSPRDASNVHITVPATDKVQSILEERCRVLEEQLQRASTAAESESLAAHAAQDAVHRAESEAAFGEGAAMRLEAQLRTELLDVRGEHQRERERLRGEAKRLQAALKDAQTRARSASEARAAVGEQASSLADELAGAKAELARRGKEGHEARAALATLDARMSQHMELFHWVLTRCAEVLGEDPAQDPLLSGSTGFEDGFCRIVGRTLTLLQRRAAEPADVGKDSARRLAAVQGELLHLKVRNEELEAVQRALQEQLAAADREQAVAAPPLEPEQLTAAAQRGPGFALRTEHRFRIRTAEDAQKFLQRRLVDLEGAGERMREEHEEAVETLQARLAGLQRAKEAGERYIESEEDAWIEAQRRARAEEAAVAEAHSEMRRALAGARDAHADAVASRAKAHAAEALRRRAEVELAELRSLPAPPPASPGMSTRNFFDHQEGVAQGQVLEWQAVAERANSEVATFRHALDASAAIIGNLEQRCEQQSKQWSRVDEAKRGWVQKALDEQERELRGKLESEVQARAEGEAVALRRLASDLREAQGRLAEAQGRISSLTLQVQEERVAIARRQQLEQQAQAFARDVAELREAHATSARRLAEELEGARAVHAALAQAAQAASAGEAVEAEAARREARSRSLSARGRRVALREELRMELQEELQGKCWLALQAEVRAQVREEVRHDPCSTLRRELCEDLRQELRDQFRSELQASGLPSGSLCSTPPPGPPQLTTPRSAPAVASLWRGGGPPLARGCDDSHRDRGARTPPSSIPCAYSSTAVGGSSFRSPTSLTDSAPTGAKSPRGLGGWPRERLYDTFAQVAAESSPHTWPLQVAATSPFDGFVSSSSAMASGIAPFDPLELQHQEHLRRDRGASLMSSADAGAWHQMALDSSLAHDAASVLEAVSAARFQASLLRSSPSGLR